MAFDHSMWSVSLAWLVISLASTYSGDPKVVFHAPEPQQSISGRTMLIDVEISGLLVPQQAMGILLLDGHKLMEVRQQHVKVSMDGAGGLSEGQHSVRLQLMDSDNSILLSETVTFIKEGSPEQLAGPFHDDRYDDETLHEMRAVCGEMHAKTAHPRGRCSMQQCIIALGLPVVSSRTKYDGEEYDDMRVTQARADFIDNFWDLPMMKIFLPSFLEKSKFETGNYTYKIYFGFDKGDPFFDNEENRRALNLHLEKLKLEMPVQFFWYRYEDMEGKVFWIYNDLFRQAYMEGADYFYMVNDDLLIVTAGWVDRFVTALESSPIMPNFGVAGPLDIRDRHKHHMCFVFHSRLHYEIFGEFYPQAFQNWWSDYWATLVYGPDATFWFRDVEVRNTELEGRRYPAFWEGSDLFADEVAAGRKRITQFCECHLAQGRWRFNACAMDETKTSTPSVHSFGTQRFAQKPSPMDTHQLPRSIEL